MNLAQQLDTSQFCGPAASAVQAADAYLRTRERGLAAGKALEIPSVASVFVSQGTRWPIRCRPEKCMARSDWRWSRRSTTPIAHCWKANDGGPRRRPRGSVCHRFCGRPPRRRTECFPDVYYLDRLAALGTIDTVPDNHGSLDDPLELDCSAAEQTVAAVAVEGIDVNALGESLQRQGTKAFPADWVTLQEVITVKAARFDAAV